MGGVKSYDPYWWIICGEREDGTVDIMNGTTGRDILLNVPREWAEKFIEKHNDDIVDLWEYERGLKLSRRGS